MMGIDKVLETEDDAKSNKSLETVAEGGELLCQLSNDAAVVARISVALCCVLVSDWQATRVKCYETQLCELLLSTTMLLPALHWQQSNSAF